MFYLTIFSSTRKKTKKKTSKKGLSKTNDDLSKIPVSSTVTKATSDYTGVTESDHMVSIDEPEVFGNNISNSSLFLSNTQNKPITQNNTLKNEDNMFKDVQVKKETSFDEGEISRKKSTSSSRQNTEGKRTPANI